MSAVVWASFLSKSTYDHVIALQSRLQAGHCATIYLMLVCAVGPSACATPAAPPQVSSLPVPQLVEIPVVLVPKTREPVPKGARIVITELHGPCSEEVADALARRLTYNSDYDVVTRENLGQILLEQQRSWQGGEFNTKTAAKLGELLGASMFIVGRVSLCGRATGADGTPMHYIQASLQLIELDTGRVILSSADKGLFVPKDVASVEWIVEREAAPAKESGRVEELPTEGLPREPGSAWQRAVDVVKRRTQQLIKADEDAPGAATPEVSQGGTSDDPLDFPTLLAAEDMASSFADKFFARPSWSAVEMWTSPEWLHSRSLELVRLGDCRAALRFLEANAKAEVSRLVDRPGELARYLHNYGVTLLCAGDLENAAKKLRSAFRVDGHPTTERMLALAGKLREWSLEFEDDEQPEVDLLIQRREDRRLK